MKHKYSGQITLETAIILPIVMIVVATFMCIALYIHDVIVIKSYGYSLAMEHKEENLEGFTRNVKNGMAKAPLFVIGTDVKCLNKTGEYQMILCLKNQDKTGWLGVFFAQKKNMIIKVERKLNPEVMYAARAIYDN